MGWVSRDCYLIVCLQLILNLVSWWDWWLQLSSKCSWIDSRVLSWRELDWFTDSRIWCSSWSCQLPKICGCPYCYCCSYYWWRWQRWWFLWITSCGRSGLRGLDLCQSWATFWNWRSFPTSLFLRLRLGMGASCISAWVWWCYQHWIMISGMNEWMFERGLVGRNKSLANKIIASWWTAMCNHCFSRVVLLSTYYSYLVIQLEFWLGVGCFAYNLPCSVCFGACSESLWGFEQRSFYIGSLGA